MDALCARRGGGAAGGQTGEALVGFQGRGCAEVVQLDFWHPHLLEVLLFQWPSKCVTILGPRWSIRPRNPIRASLLSNQVMHVFVNPRPVLDELKNAHAASSCVSCRSRSSGSRCLTAASKN